MQWFMKHYSHAVRHSAKSSVSSKRALREFTVTCDWGERLKKQKAGLNGLPHNTVWHVGLSCVRSHC